MLKISTLLEYHVRKQKMKIRWFIVLIASAALVASMVMAAENKGAEQISINGGSRGNIPFSHHAHQDRLNDCNICHSVFPQESDALYKLKESGSLARKQVMNKLCIKCHKAEKKAGNKTAPTTCSKCHVK
jgi:hypothetical protein